MCRSRWIRVISRVVPALLLCSVPAWAGIVLPPTILTVGNTGNCDHNSIQAAINAAAAVGNTVIRISNNVAHSNQALSISNKNIELRGGYPGCDLAPSDPDARTTINGNGGDSVIFTTSAGTARTVILRNLVIRGGGSSDPLTERGGGVRIEGLSRVEVRNSRISDNESHNGGGIYIQGGDAELVLDDGTIVGEAGEFAGNRAVANGIAAVRGGGISCSSADLYILDARLRVNTSEEDGGGLYAQTCNILITPRPAFVEGVNGADGFVTFFENRADRDGGAMYVSNGAVTWRSADISGHFGGRATGNSAGNSGGALYLTGSGLDFDTEWVRFEGNDAPNTGGTVRVQDDASFTLRGAAGMRCDYSTCPAIFESNLAAAHQTASGGAIYATDGGDVFLLQTLLARNVAAAGSALLAFGEGTRVTLRHVLLHQNFLTLANNLDSPLSIILGADADVIHLTAAGNLRPGGLLFTQPVSTVLASGAGTSVDLFNSIFSDDSLSAARALNGAGATASCSMSHEDQSVPGLVIGAPGYDDPGADPPDFSLDIQSEAIDRCASAETFPMSPLPDITGQERPVDLVTADNDLGPWDMGAFEAFFLIAQPIDIFTDGFEDLAP